MKRTRRRFLKAALGCVTAVFVPGVLLTEKKPLNTVTLLPAFFKPTARENMMSWYKPGIWAMPKGSEKGIKGMVVIHADKNFVFMKMDDGAWAIRDANNPGSPLAKEV